jgi:hypothetical protein
MPQWFEHNTYISERDLLSEFYMECRLAGVKIRMEVFVPSTIHRSKRMRADCAIYKNGKIHALVEGKTPGHVVGGNTRQRHAYDSVFKNYGIRTHWLNDMKQIAPLVAQLRRECSELEASPG